MPSGAGQYLPRHFALDDLAQLHAFIRATGACTLITLGDELEATLVPVVLHADDGSGGFGKLRGHLAKANLQLVRRRAQTRALAIFAGPAHYVTPAWYATKRRTGKVVPTYDYTVVQARGTLRTIDDRAAVRAHLATLTAEHERTVGSDWRIGDAPADYIESLVDAIVAFELPIDEISGKWKLSQNRPPDDIDGVVRGLAELATPQACEMAQLIERFRPAR